MSAQHTSRVIGPLLRWIWPDISLVTVAAVQLAVRKAAHLTEYAILAILLARVTDSPVVPRRWQCGVLVMMIAVPYAALDEFHQSFVLSRTPSILDVMIDTIGALIGLLASCFRGRRSPGADAIAQAPAEKLAARRVRRR